ncbi:MAG: efflux RND transporter permease subunit [Deltaproteobacteria bacterium]|nr:efflux RND transporter permease subunit [Deltaproteobacteria bacterium]
MGGVPQVRQVRSLTRSGLSQVVVIFEDGVDIYFARQQVHERLSQARESLPEGIDAEMGPISTGLGEIYGYTIESGHTCAKHPRVWQEAPGKCPHDGLDLVKPDHSLADLRSIQEWLVAPRLRGVPGVNEVNSLGGYVKTLEVAPRADRLVEFGLTVRDVVEAVAAGNANEGGGFIARGDEQSYVVSRGLLTGAGDLERTVVKSEGGTPVLLGQVADVREGSLPRQGAVSRDGKGEAVAGMVILLKGENSRVVVDRVVGEVEDIRRSLPAGTNIVPFYDRTDLIGACIGTVRDALVEGAGLVIIVLLLFLWDLRSALVVALSLPLTASLTFLLMRALGETANLMSLGGLAIAVGMVVDGAIVVVETIHSNRQRNPDMERLASAAAAVREVARPITFSILVIVAVILPLFSLQEVEGKMFRPMAITIAAAMASSLVVALVLVPPLAVLLQGRGGGRENPVVRGLLAVYGPSLDWSVRHRIPLALVSAGFLVGTAFLVPRLGTEFLPPLDEGTIAVNVVRLPSASLDGSLAQATVLERLILESVPEVTGVVSKTGTAEVAEDPMGPEQNDFMVSLAPRDEWRPGLTRDRLIGELQEVFSRVPGIRASFSQPIALRVNELISGVKSDVALRIFGDDEQTLREAAEQAARILSEVPGAEDVKVEQSSGVSEIEIIPDREALARHQLRIQDVNDLVRINLAGVPAGRMVDGQRWNPIRVVSADAARGGLETIRNLPVLTPAGARLRLRDLAEVREVEAPAQLSREQGQRRLITECNVRGRDLGSFVAEARERLAQLEAGLPSGYRLAWGGQFENQERATRRLMLVVPAVLLVIALLQYAAMGNARSTLLVVTNLPFSVVGGIGTIYLLDMHVSVSVLVGLIALLGMAVQHGTLVVSFIDELRAGGLPLAEAVREASKRRLRPLLMTKLTSLLGLVPMMLAQGPGADIQRPLAAVVLGGLAFTSALNLYVVPALYGWFHREQTTGR